MPDSHWLEVRPVAEDPETLREFVSDGEWMVAMSMGSASRRAEWLAWRAIAGERLGRGAVVSYDDAGAPVLPAGMGCIGVSHTQGWVAVVWSPEPCAVDIEPVSRDVSRTARRFISDEEYALSDSSHPLFPVSAWCAKETAYKLARIRGLDFRNDIRIAASDIGRGIMEMSVRGAEAIRIDLIFRYGLVIAVAV